MLLGNLYTAGGQAPRTDELLSLDCDNGPSTAHDIYIWNKSRIYVIRRGKVKIVTNREFNVVRFLPIRLGQAIYWYMVYVRRVAALFRRERLGYRSRRYRPATASPLSLRQRGMETSADNVNTGESYRPYILPTIVEELAIDISGKYACRSTCMTIGILKRI